MKDYEWQNVDIVPGNIKYLRKCPVIQTSVQSFKLINLMYQMHSSLWEPLTTGNVLMCNKGKQ